MTSAEEFEAEVLEMAFDLLQPFRCIHCGHAVKRGMCCGYCGSDSPDDINDKSGIWDGK